MTPSLDFIRRKVTYHHWAADRAMDGVAKLSAQQLDTPLGGSFGTGRALLNHVVGVERLWLERLSGRPTGGVPKFPETHSGTDMQREWHVIRDEQKRFVDQLGADKVAQKMTWKNVKGEELTALTSEVFEHLVNHGSYHRGQISHLLRDRGVAAVGTDYFIFMLERPL
jgi:uncharacterized damage-inducible protein DinB